MKNKDLQTLEMLRGEFDKSVDSAKVPLRLQKESIVNMLERDRQKQTDFSDKTGTKKHNISMLRKTAAIAAMLAIVVIGALAMRVGGGVSKIKSDSFYESGALVKNAQSYEEVEREVREILGIEETPTAPSSEQTNTSDITWSSRPNGQTSTDSPLGSSGKNLLDGYSYYVENDGSGSEQGSASAASNLHTGNSAGVSVYGDFEADIVKVNGDYLYVASTGTNAQTGQTVEQVSIVKIVPSDKMQVVSTIVLSSGDSADTVDECVEIYLKDNKLIAIMKRCSYSTYDAVYSDNVSTLALYYDISNPTAPKKLREHVQDGEFVSSKFSGGKLYLATAASIDGVSGNASVDDIIPAFSVDGAETKVDAKNIFNDGESIHDASFLFVTVTEVSDFSSPVAQLAFFGGGKDVYCSSGAIVVAKGYISDEEVNEKTGEPKRRTAIYRFNVNGSSIELAGTGLVDGFIVNGFSVDESKGYLRAVTSVNGAHNVYVLNENMELVGGLEKVFPGETAKTVKYIGSKGYVVSGTNGEKTMIIDFSKSEPKVAGMISTKGFSDSLYEISDSMLLGVEILRNDNNTESETGDDYSVINLTLFDVSDPENPKTASVYELSKEYYLAAGTDGRCVMIDSERQIFGLPIVKTDAETGNDISSCMLFSVADGKISLAGVCNHDSAVIGDAAVRSVCVGDTIYTVSGEKIVSFSAEDYKEISFVEIR